MPDTYKLDAPILATYQAVSLCGSVISTSSFHDIDFVVKSQFKYHALEEHLWNHFERKYDCDFIYSLQGSNWNHIPIGHFVMIPIGDTSLADETLYKCELFPKVEGLKPVVFLPDFLTLYNAKFYIKQFTKDTGLELKIVRHFPEAFEFEYVDTLPADPICSLAFIPVREATLVRVPVFGTENTLESLRSPFQKIEPMKAKSGYSQFEFFDVDSFWNIWGRTNAETGFYLEPKVDGIRMIGAKKGDKVVIYTEDKKRERQNVLVDVAAELKSLPIKECVIDGELVWFRNGEPIPRWEMAALVSRKEPIEGEDLRWFIFDCLYASPNGSLIDLPIEERRAFLDKIIPNDRKHLYRLPSYTAHTKKETEKAFEKCSRFPSSEGAMCKLVGSKYDIYGRTGNWAKIKMAREVHAEVIGVFKKANPFPPGKKPTRTIEGEEALRLYKSLQEGSKTYILRCAVRRGDTLVPIDADRKLTASDFSVKWNAETNPPKWQGLDDPRLWDMSPKVKQRKVGDYAFGNTYARAFDSPPKIGDIVVVRPIKVRIFDDRISWMFPVLHHKDETRTMADTVDIIKRMAEAGSVLDRAKERIISEGWPRAFPTAGSKLKLAPFLVANIPEHDTFVEPFVGGGSVFFTRDERAKKEVINDIDLDAIAFYKELQKDPKGFVAYLRTKSFASSRVRFERMKSWKPLRNRDRAYKHIYLSWTSFEGTKLRPRITWRKGMFNLERRLKKLELTGERLKGVQITSEDGVACIKKWDSPTTFFYLDPPYPKVGKGLFKVGSFPYDLNEFASILRKVKGKFLLSLNDIPEIRAAFKGFYVYQVITSYPRFALRGHSNKYSELLISNYPLPRPGANHRKAIRRVRAISSPAREATREEQRKKAEKELGDWYMVESDKIVPTRVQYHVRGIWVGDELTACREAIRKDREAAWKKYELVTLKAPLEEIRKAVQKADDEKGDVSGVISSFLDSSPTDAPLDRVYTLGSIHGDWRKPHPDMSSLVSSWTLNVQKSCLQRISDGEVVFLMRDRVMENQEGDNFLSEKKCPGVIDEDEDDLLPHIVNLPGLVEESFETLVSMFPEPLYEALDRPSSDAAEIVYEAIQPILWLNLVSKKRKVVDVPAKSLPEGEGEVLASTSRFIWVADTKMVYGTQKSDYHEYFHFFGNINPDIPHNSPEALSGRWNWIKVKGRPSYTKAPRDEFWLGSRPKEQRPYLLTHDRKREEDKAAREKIKLIWNDSVIDLLRSLGYRHLS